MQNVVGNACAAEGLNVWAKDPGRGTRQLSKRRLGPGERGGGPVLFESPLPPVNYLYFHQYSGPKTLSIFVFINIPAFSASFLQRSFVFIDIPASFRHFLSLLRFFFLRQATLCPVVRGMSKVFSTPLPLTWTTRSHRRQKGPGQFTIHYSFPLAPALPPPARTSDHGPGILRWATGRAGFLTPP
jgi:hypothetical protein